MVAVMQTAEPGRSDVGLAGLMLRCSKNGVDVVIVTVKAFRPRARPRVRLTAGGTTKELVATVLSPGLSLVLPAEATFLADSIWLSASTLGIDIDDDGDKTVGSVSLIGLAATRAALMANCPFQ